MKRNSLGYRLFGLASLIGLSVAASGCIARVQGPNGTTTYVNFVKQVDRAKVCATVLKNGKRVTMKMAQFESTYKLEKKLRSNSQELWLGTRAETCFWVKFNKSVSIKDLELGELWITVDDASARGVLESIGENNVLNVVYDLSHPQNPNASNFEEAQIKKALSSLTRPAGEQSEIPTEATASISEFKYLSLPQSIESNSENCESGAGQHS